MFSIFDSRKWKILKEFSLTKLKELTKKHNIKVERGLVDLRGEKELYVETLTNSKELTLMEVLKEQKKATSKPKTKRKYIPRVWRERALERQKWKCAGKDCVKIHGKRMDLRKVVRHGDHIKPIEIGGEHIPSNVQILCPNCHSRKTREDRKKIADFKRRKEKRKSVKRKRKPKRRTLKPWESTIKPF